MLGKNITAVFPRSLLHEGPLLERMRAISEKGGQEQIPDLHYKSGEREA